MARNFQEVHTVFQINLTQKSISRGDFIKFWTFYQLYSEVIISLGLRTLFFNLLSSYAFCVRRNHGKHSILIRKKKKYLENFKAELRRQLHLFSAIALTYLRILCVDFFLLFVFAFIYLQHVF